MAPSPYLVSDQQKGAGEGVGVRTPTLGESEPLESVSTRSISDTDGFMPVTQGYSTDYNSLNLNFRTIMNRIVILKDTFATFDKFLK